MVDRLTTIPPQFRPASFRGARFFVDSASEDFGRRIVVHEFPGSDNNFNEDLGRKARRFSLEGCLVGNSWLTDRDALKAACEANGPATLVHPFYNQNIQARCETVSFSESKTDLGKIKVRMQFVEEITQTAIISASFIRTLVRTSLAAVVKSSSANFTKTLKSREFGDSVRTLGKGQIEGWAGALDGAAKRTILADGSGLTKSIENLFDGAESIIGGANPESLITDFITNFRGSIASPEDGAAGLRDLIFTGVDSRIGTHASKTALQRAQNTITIDNLFRRAVGGLWAELTVSRDFSSRAEATASRNTLVRWLDSELSLIDPHLEEGILDDFDRYRARLIEDITRKHTDAAPIRRVKLPRRRSALALAATIYGNVDQALDIWKRNGSPHPAAIGSDIEVLVR